uniref:EGF-like domain-containing protein n=1 Tax=Clytia hemisphaerica TaxID=252671 RepID=A0A7M5XN09_9CNID
YTDIDECTELGANGLPLHNCAAGTQVCVNTIGSFRCDSALQQCTVGRCPGANKVCQNIQTSPGYSCSCNTNFVPSVVANSIDCVLPCANNPCQANSACTNNGNSFICTCNSGYKEVNNVCVGKSLLYNKNK